MQPLLHEDREVLLEIKMQKSCSIKDHQELFLRIFDYLRNCLTDFTKNMSCSRKIE